MHDEYRVFAIESKMLFQMSLQMSLQNKRNNEVIKMRKYKSDYERLYIIKWRQKNIRQKEERKLKESDINAFIETLENGEILFE